jgi:hypothetical protein
MATYRNATDDPDCESAGRTVFLGNIGLIDFDEPDTTIANPATSILAIDVISALGTSGWRFHFVTLELELEAPSGALFVNHSERDNYHREVLADPFAGSRPDPDVVYWRESDDDTTTLRIREDETALLSGPGNGRTYYVGVAGLGADPHVDPEALRFTAVAAGSLVREASCRMTIDQLHAGDRIAGYLD